MTKTISIRHPLSANEKIPRYCKPETIEYGLPIVVGFFPRTGEP